MTDPLHAFYNAMGKYAEILTKSKKEKHQKRDTVMVLFLCFIIFMCVFVFVSDGGRQNQSPMPMLSIRRLLNSFAVL